MNKQQIDTIIEQIEVGTEVLVNVTHSSDVKLRGGKKNELQGRVTKTTVGSTALLARDSHQYRKHVEANNPDGEKTSGKRVWGTHVPNSPYITHGEKTYVQMIFQERGKTQYLVDGKEPTKEQLDQILETKFASPAPTNDVVVRAINLENISELTIV